ncbi:uncharacterized protein [Physcomitrium patens]|uniref:Choline transporter-like protein n=1 Tax=Physcomitrium patens TaxID=3218 RepID=A0A2K1J1W1_PHYPA|nr:uncharacterized protein LOC112294979 [Physcomitrium patens]XP_024401780.1 uncharacterized protein LOC112294979 [Physcomitrium patens]XP_024401781.1 uncharacterized protein LOC112294979 [Physcomitrium patens]PNR35519.1 hypothetical protein PHYPA_023419 [Physcomitrium patens]|eukprot:XP_024401779.1 uncharacterized protein LOC112294979 [Physcomitrella patens]
MLDLGLRVQEFEYQDAAMEYYNEHERLRPYAPRDEYVLQTREGPDYIFEGTTPASDPYWKPPLFRAVPVYQPFPLREDYRRGVPYEVYPRTLSPPTYTPDDLIGSIFDFRPPPQCVYGRGPSYWRFDSGRGSEHGIRWPLQEFPLSDYHRRPTHEFDYGRRPQPQHELRPPEFNNRPWLYLDQGPPEFDRRHPPDVDKRYLPEFDRRQSPDFDGRHPPELNRRHPPEFDLRQPPEIERRYPPQVDRSYPHEFDRRQPPGFDGGQPSEVDRRYPQEFDRRYPQEFDRRYPPEVGRRYPPEVDRRHPPEVDRRHPPEVDRRYPPEVDRRHPPEVYRRYPHGFDPWQPSEVNRIHPPEFDLRYPPRVYRRQPPDFNRRYPPEVDRRQPPDFNRRYPPEVVRRQAPDFDRRYPPEFDRRPQPQYDNRPVQEIDPRPPELDRRAPHEYEQRRHHEFGRRPELPSEKRPEPLYDHGPPPPPPPKSDQRNPPTVVPSDAGLQPPLSSELQQQSHRPESPKRAASPPQQAAALSPKDNAKETAASPPRPPADDVGSQIPPTPSEPVAAPPSPQEDTSRDISREQQPPDVEPQFVVPVPCETEDRPPDKPAHHQLDEFPEGNPPEKDIEGRGDLGAVSYATHMEVGPPSLGKDVYYVPTTEHGRVKWKHFQACKHYWAGFLFILHFWVGVGVCIYLGVRGVIKTNQNEELVRTYALAHSPAPLLPERLYNMKHWAPQLAVATGAGWLFAFIWQSLIRAHPAPMIKISLYLGTLCTGLLGIILLSTGTAKGLVGLLFLALALFQGLYVHHVRHRMEFTGIMLRKAILAVHEYKSLYILSVWTVFLAMFWLALWIFGVSGALSFTYGGYYVALLVVSLAWSIEVLRNTINVTVAGVVGTNYYEMGNKPHFPVLRSYQRAWTVSFGSVCLGSMFVGPVTALHALAKHIANEQGSNEFLFSCTNCLLGLMEYLIRHFNKWAFVGVGLHGKSFATSAKETWRIFQETETMLLVSDDLTGAVLFTGCIIGGVVTALVGGCWSFATRRYLTVGVSIISFFLGFLVTYLTMAVSESAVAANYVCFAEDSNILSKHDPALAQYMIHRKNKLDERLA